MLKTNPLSPFYFVEVLNSWNPCCPHSGRRLLSINLTKTSPHRPTYLTACLSHRPDWSFILQMILDPVKLTVNLLPFLLLFLQIYFVSILPQCVYLCTTCMPTDGCEVRTKNSRCSQPQSHLCSPDTVFTVSHAQRHSPSSSVFWRWCLFVCLFIYFLH